MFFKLLFSPKPAFLALWSPRKNQRGSFKSQRPWCVFSRKVSLILPDLLLPRGGEYRINKHEWRWAWSRVFRTQTVRPHDVMVWTAKIKGPLGASFCLQDVNPSFLLMSIGSTGCGSSCAGPWSATVQMLNQTDAGGWGGIYSANCTCLFGQAGPCSDPPPPTHPTHRSSGSLQTVHPGAQGLTTGVPPADST